MPDTETPHHPRPKHLPPNHDPSALSDPSDLSVSTEGPQPTRVWHTVVLCLAGLFGGIGILAGLAAILLALLSLSVDDEQYASQMYRESATFLLIGIGCLLITLLLARAIRTPRASGLPYTAPLPILLAFLGLVGCGGYHASPDRARDADAVLRTTKVFHLRAALLHQAAMAQFVDFSSRPIPAEIIDQFVSREQSPRIGVHVPFWEYPATPSFPLLDANGEPLVVSCKEDMVFGGPVMMAYLPAEHRKAALQDPFARDQRAMKAIIVGNEYYVAGVGPDQREDLKSAVVESEDILASFRYDPTNGIISAGDLLWPGPPARTSP
jgi:hypothetical protein